MLFLGPPPTLQTAKVYEPKAGSKERKAIMDALRKAVTPSVRQPVAFKTTWIRSNGTVAFLYGTPQKPNGKPLDYSKTDYAANVKDGIFDDGFSALLRKRNGKWRTTFWEIGSTDVAWDGLWDREKVPRALFPGPG